MADLPKPIDSFTRMNQAATEERGEKARVSVTVSRSIQYGEVKCSFTLAVSCPQTQQWMDYAAEHIFAQAVQYVNSGMDWVSPGLPALNVPTPKFT